MKQPVDAGWEKRFPLNGTRETCSCGARSTDTETPAEDDIRRAIPVVTPLPSWYVSRSACIRFTTYKYTRATVTHAHAPRRDDSPPEGAIYYPRDEASRDCNPIPNPVPPRILRTQACLSYPNRFKKPVLWQLRRTDDEVSLFRARGNDGKFAKIAARSLFAARWHADIALRVRNGFLSLLNGGWISSKVLSSNFAEDGLRFQLLTTKRFWGALTERWLETVDISVHPRVKASFVWELNKFEILYTTGSL